MGALENHDSVATSHDKPIYDIPFEGLSGSYEPTSYRELDQYLDLDVSFDPSDPVILGNLKSSRQTGPTNRVAQNQSVDDLVAIFDACIYIGDVNRAASILKRLGSREIDPERLMVLHDDLLSEKLLQLMDNPTEERADAMHSWFELETYSQGRLITTEMIAYMLKTSLLTTQGQSLSKLVDRYMNLLPQETALESLYMVGILTAKDLSTIVELCPVYNLPEGAPDLAHDVLDNRDAELEVLRTPLKGLGLKSVHRTLSLFSSVPIGKDIASLPVPEQQELQAQLERDTIEAALDRWREENENLRAMGLNPSFSSRSLSATFHEWHKGLKEYLTEEIALVEAAELSPKKSKVELDRCQYGPFLKQCEPRRLAAVTIISVLTNLTTYGLERGVTFANLVSNLVKLIEADVHAQAKEKAGKKHKSLGRARPMRLNHRGTAEGWPVEVRAKLGAVVILGILKKCKIYVSRKVSPDTKGADHRGMVHQQQAAFVHNIKYAKGIKQGFVLPNPELARRMTREPCAGSLAKHLPMVAEPSPWTKFDEGGFLASPVSLVRLKDGDQEQRYYAEAAIARGDMAPVLRGLDILGKTAWRINRPIFDVMLEVWNSGQGFTNIPSLNPDLPIPEEPEPSEDSSARKAWIKAVRAVEDQRSGLHSVRCFMNFQLEIARAFVDQTFYFPHNIDFRGRAYPMPTYLNHMGADHVRGLLCFAKGKPLGESGLRWLKVHLANVYGFAKASLAEREEFSTEHWADILDSAENPLGGQRWWAGGEDPWQTLAACKELKAALESPDPTQFVSHLAVHQDGTCNGLQHYAALGGDTWGAQQVNLLPGDRPADVYAAVADLVSKAIDKDAKSGNEMAKYLQGKVTRKVVKQTVMTNVYGVTFVGAKKQITKQLDSLYPNMEAETGTNALWFGSYIAKLVFLSLTSMFGGAQHLQQWLLDAGGRICRAVLAEQIDELSHDPRWGNVIDRAVEIAVNDGVDPSLGPEGWAKTRDQKIPDEDPRHLFQSTIVWTTPLSMPVVQPYRKVKTKPIETCVQSLVLLDAKTTDSVHRSKQLQAFPPNFIHSLDASHMLLSAMDCHRRGLEFAAVHDSFWTHAADVDTMNQVLRDSFIRIHSEDVIGRLAAEFEARYRGSIFLAEAGGDTLLGRTIQAYRKRVKFLGSLNLELQVERIRQRLLQSQGPAERARGQKMVTPASLYEQMEDSHQDLTSFSNAGRIKVATLLDANPEAGDIDEPSAEVDEAVVAEATDAGPLPTGLEKRQQSHPTRVKGVYFWLPFHVPPLPKKGNLDVQQLRDSKYFFS